MIFGERTRPRVLVSAPRRNESFITDRQVSAGEDATPAREARALPESLRQDSFPSDESWCASTNQSSRFATRFSANAARASR